MRPCRPTAIGEFWHPTATSEARPAVLVLGGSEGGLPGVLLPAMLASAGYPALGVAYFGEPSLPNVLSRIPLEYFAKALSWLARQPGVNPAEIAVLGISRGSEAAQLLGVYYPKLVHAVIASVPADQEADRAIWPHLLQLPCRASRQPDEVAAAWSWL